MEVILLERVAKLGQMGEVVRVRDGFARNFLLPNHKALRATDANKSKFERDRTMLEARNADARKAGFADLAEFRNWLNTMKAGPLFQRIEVSYIGEP